MQFLDQLSDFLRQGIAAIGSFIRKFYGRWVAPWDKLSTLPAWMIVLLWLFRILLAGVIVYMLVQAELDGTIQTCRGRCPPRHHPIPSGGPPPPNRIEWTFPR